MNTQIKTFDIIKKLKENNQKIATAESCTGGLLAAEITSISGASEVFELGVVTYSNEQKSKILGVSAQTLAEYGAVSAQTVIEMALSVAKLAPADISVSISGIAGPGGGTKNKPVGTVFIGICKNQKAFAHEFHFLGNRDEVRRQTVESALDLLTQLF
ncbi:MAG: CinA family protein [Clostridia bacterium]